jgi:hypothetical protein
MRWAHRLSTPTLVALLLLVSAAFVAETGSVPHSHDSASPALFNEEHDLTLLATGGAVALPDALPLLIAFVVVATLAIFAARRPAIAPRRGADSRAPPVR